MTEFQQASYRPRRGLAVSVAVFLAVIIAFLAMLESVSGSTDRRQRESLERALNRCVTYCYAVEGEYPPSLSYIRQNYGLYYDESRFFVDYRYLGGNMLPDITILEKEG